MGIITQRTAAIVATVGLSVAIGATLRIDAATKGQSTSPIDTPAASGAPLAPGTPQAPVSSQPPYAPVIAPADFVGQVTNPYFPLVPGTTFIVEGSRDGVPRHNEMTVTNETKVIMGIPTVVVRDVSTSKTALLEKTTDWYAQDKAGNVWYFGEDTAEYENGLVTSTSGTWMAGVDGALPGIIMQAAPQAGDAYRQEYLPGIAEDFASVLQTDASVKVPAGDYAAVVVTEDIDLLDQTKLEHKSFAPGVGWVAGDSWVNGHHEVLALVSILSPR